MCMYVLSRQDIIRVRPCIKTSQYCFLADINSAIYDKQTMLTVLSCLAVYNINNIWKLEKNFFRSGNIFLLFPELQNVVRPATRLMSLSLETALRKFAMTNVIKIGHIKNEFDAQCNHCVDLSDKETSHR